MKIEMAPSQQSTRQRLAWALAPLGLGFLAFSSGWAWQALDQPLALGLPPPYFGVFGLLALGAFEAVRRGLPPWAYSWVAQALHALGPLASVLVVFTVLPRTPLASTGADRTYVWASLGIHQLWLLLGLVAALLLARRSSQDAFFFFALFLGAKLVTYPIQGSTPLQLPPHAVNGALAALAMVEGLGMAAVLYRFLGGDPLSWRPFWSLLVLLLLDPPLKLWPLLLRNGDLSGHLRELLVAVGMAWFPTLGALLAAYLAIRVSLAWRERVV